MIAKLHVQPRRLDSRRRLEPVAVSFSVRVEKGDALHAVFSGELAHLGLQACRHHVEARLLRLPEFFLQRPLLLSRRLPDERPEIRELFQHRRGLAGRFHAG